MKAILIFTTENDHSTTEIIYWLKLLDVNIRIYRINDSDFVEIIIEQDKVRIKSNGLEIDVNSKLRIYYRRGNLFRHINFNNLQINRIIEREVRHFKEFFFTILQEKCFVLGSYPARRRLKLSI